MDKISRFNHFVKSKLCTEQYFILENFKLTLEINIVCSLIEKIRRYDYPSSELKKKYLKQHAVELKKYQLFLLALGKFIL